MYSNSVHQPTLSTIRMVERTIKKKHYLRSKNQLFAKLPKQVMFRTLGTILQYLEESNKVTLNKDGSILWIFRDSTKIKARLKKPKRRIAKK
jgi:meiotically up-regulated gene 157 (Mug157) protein